MDFENQYLYYNEYTKLGGKIQKALLQRADDYQEKRIRIRPYGLVRISCIALSLIITICYFAINACYIDAMFYVCILTAYTLFKLETVFSKKHHFLCLQKHNYMI